MVPAGPWLAPPLAAKGLLWLAPPLVEKELVAGCPAVTAVGGCENVLQLVGAGAIAGAPELTVGSVAIASGSASTLDEAFILLDSVVWLPT